MGMNTTVFILNDFLNQIKENPKQFVEELIDAINAGQHAERKYVFGQTTVVPTCHADVPRLYLTHKNGIVDLSFSWNVEKASDHELEFLKKYAKTAGSLLRQFNADLRKETEKRKK